MKYIYSLRTGIENLIRDDNCFFIGEDIQEPYGGAFKVTKGLSEKYPDNIIGVPMCEQGFTGIGIGMAIYGCFVCVEIMFGDFITLAADQMINHAAKFKGLYREDIHFVLRCPSGAYRGYGATHSQSLEKMYMGIPGIQVIAPSIAHNPGKLLEKAVKSGTPTLFVENKLDYPRDLLENEGVFWKKEIMQKSLEFPIIKISPVDEKPDATIITYGGMVEIAISAMKELLYEEEINIELIVPSLLTDINPIPAICSSSKILIVEEGVRDFGWGSEVYSCLVEHGFKCNRIGADNKVIPASEAELSILPSVDKIVNFIRQEV